MKCYLCKKIISVSTRVYLDARNRREKGQFRDLCWTCYDEKMKADGYKLTKRESGVNFWEKEG